jgi:hypothetical protein
MSCRSVDDYDSNYLVRYMGCYIYDHYDDFVSINNGTEYSNIEEIVEGDGCSKTRTLIRESYPNLNDKGVNAFVLSTLLYLHMISTQPIRH